MDSPVMCGAFFRDIEFCRREKTSHTLHIAADGPAALEAKREVAAPAAIDCGGMGDLWGAAFAVRFFCWRFRPDAAGWSWHARNRADNRTPEALFLGTRTCARPQIGFAGERIYALVEWKNTGGQRGWRRRITKAPMKGDFALGVLRACRSITGKSFRAGGFWTPKIRDTGATAAYLKPTGRGGPGAICRTRRLAAQLL